MTKKHSFKYEELINCANGELFGPGNAKLPLPPMLMFDRITNIQEMKGKFNKGLVEAELVIKPNSDKNATTPNQKAYRSLWGDYNTVKTLAVNGGKFMLINRFVSMVDALLLAKKWNNEHDVKLSLNAYPDLRNKLGVGGVKLSLRW